MMPPDLKIIETEDGLEMLQDIELGLRVSHAVAFESFFPQLAIWERVVEAKWGLRIGGWGI